MADQFGWFRKHPVDADLRSLLDGEAAQAVDSHVADCPTCQARLENLRQQAGFVRQRVEVLQSTPVELTARQAAAILSQRAVQHQETSMLKTLFTRWRPAIAVVTVIAVLALSLVIPQVRAAAVGFLNLFRVQQITVLEFNPNALPENFERSFANLDQMMAEQVQIDMQGDVQPAASAAEAAALAGYDLRLPSALAEYAQTYSVQPGGSASMTIDVDLVNLILEEMGQNTPLLPAELDGEQIVIDASASVMTEFGNCPAAGTDADSARFHCFYLLQMPSPVVTTPPNMDVESLAISSLQLLGLSSYDARAFSARIDWTTTLVIPVPVGADYRNVTVDGVEGVLFSERFYNEGSPSGRDYFTLMWAKDGMVYSLTGSGGADEALEIAAEWE